MALPFYADAYDEHVSSCGRDHAFGTVRLRSGSVARLSNSMPLYAELLAFKAYVEGSGPPPKSSAAEALRAIEAIAEMHRLAGIA